MVRKPIFDFLAAYNENLPYLSPKPLANISLDSNSEMRILLYMGWKCQVVLERPKNEDVSY